MRARDARYGRVVAEQRGAFEPDLQPVEIHHPPAFAAMIHKLDIKSLMSLAGYCEMTLKQFEEKYQ